MIEQRKRVSGGVDPRDFGGEARILQRHVLERAQINGDFDTELEKLDTLTAASVGSAGIFRIRTGSPLSTLPGRRIDVHNNLFEIGASSLNCSKSTRVSVENFRD